MEQPPSGVALELWHAAAAVAAGAATWAWRFITGDIRKLRDTTVTKEDFTTYAADAKHKRDELREAVIDLYKKHEESETRASQRHVELLKAIHEVSK